MNTNDLPSVLDAARFVETLIPFRASPFAGAGGVPMIGYETICYPNGRPVELTDQAVTQAYAESLLVVRLTDTAHALWSYLKLAPSGNQWSALLSLADSVGSGMIGTSRLIRLFNGNAFTEAAREFDRFTDRFVDGTLVPDDSFKGRRQAERTLFETPV